MKKCRKVSKSKQSAKQTRLCSFGFTLKPSCGLYLRKFDLNKTPELREELAGGLYPPYTYFFEDPDTVIMDNCLCCFLEKGLSVEDYEKIHIAHGITRENWKEKSKILEFYMPEVETKIKAERKELIAEMLRDGMPVDMGFRCSRDC